MFIMETIIKLRSFLRESILESSVYVGHGNEIWVLTKTGLSPTEASIYLKLLKTGSTSAEIAHEFENSQSSSSTLMKRMYDKGFIYREEQEGEFVYHAVDPFRIADVVEEVFKEVGKILKIELRRLKI